MISRILNFILTTDGNAFGENTENYVNLIYSSFIVKDNNILVFVGLSHNIYNRQSEYNTEN